MNLICEEKPDGFLLFSKTIFLRNRSLSKARWLYGKKELTNMHFTVKWFSPSEMGEQWFITRFNFNPALNIIIMKKKWPQISHTHINRDFKVSCADHIFSLILEAVSFQRFKFIFHSICWCFVLFCFVFFSKKLIFSVLIKMSLAFFSLNVNCSSIFFQKEYNYIKYFTQLPLKKYPLI